MTLNNIFDAQEIGHTFDNKATDRDIDSGEDHFVEANNMVDENGDNQELNFADIPKYTEEELYFQRR